MVEKQLAAFVESRHVLIQNLLGRIGMAYMPMPVIFGMALGMISDLRTIKIN